MTTMYPAHYGTTMATLEQLDFKFFQEAHPEFRRRALAWLESEKGIIGVGESLRLVQPSGPTFAPNGKSFHQKQRFASGLYVCSAMDVVTIDGRDDNHQHDGVTWALVANAPKYGLHAFIKSPQEPWHIQCIEMRGYDAWFAGGRKDPGYFQLPTDPLPPTGGKFVHQTIRKGDVNADVYGAQVVIKHRAGQQVVVNGIFDEATDNGIKNVQRWFGLAVDGICGPKTWAVLDTLANAS